MARRTRGGAPTRCPSCGSRVVTQLVGDRAALKVTADLTPLSPSEQAKARGPNRLIWCLHPTPSGPGRLVWLTPWHPPDCPHPHVADHQCPPAEPTTLF
jgi:hypothetical protein